MPAPKPKDNIVEGPNGWKMAETVARIAERLLKGAPKGDDYAFRRVAKSVGDADLTLEKGERCDVSYVSTYDVDRDRDVVIPKGIDTSDYNGVVTFAHRYDQLPVGRCLWMKAKDNGVIAKTKYPTRPDGWQGDWMPDAILHLMQQDPPACTGKSLGIIPMVIREPLDSEIMAAPQMGRRGVRVIESCKVIEYAVTPLPINQNAELIAVSKAVNGPLADIIAEEIRRFGGAAPTPAPKPAPVTPFCRPETINAAAVRKAIESLDGLPREVCERVVARFYRMIGKP